MKAANDIGYDGFDGELETHRPVELIVALPKGTNAFINDLGHHVAEQSALLSGVTAKVVFVPQSDPIALSKRLLTFKGKADGMAVVAVDHPAVRDAIRQLIEAKMHVVTIASDIRSVPHLGYIGLDNAQAGRLAGYVLGRFIPAGKPAKVVAFAGSLSYRGHQEREMGFRQILSQEFRHLELVEIVDVHEDRDEACARMGELLRAHPDLMGIYNAGGATAGIAEAIVERPQIVFVAHDATRGNEALLLNGVLDAVIDQNARLQIREALHTLKHAVRNETYRMVPPRVQIIFRENLPSE